MAAQTQFTVVKRWVVKDGVLGTGHTGKDGTLKDFRPASVEVWQRTTRFTPAKGVDFETPALTGGAVSVTNERVSAGGKPISGYLATSALVTLPGTDEPVTVMLSDPLDLGLTPESEAIVREEKREQIESARQLEAERVRLQEAAQRAEDERRQRIRLEYYAELSLPEDMIERLVEVAVEAPISRRRLRRWLKQPMRMYPVPLPQRPSGCDWLFQYEWSREERALRERFDELVRKHGRAALTRYNAKIEAGRAARKDAWLAKNLPGERRRVR